MLISHDVQIFVRVHEGVKNIYAAKAFTAGAFTYANTMMNKLYFLAVYSCSFSTLATCQIFRVSFPKCPCQKRRKNTKHVPRVITQVYPNEVRAKRVRVKPPGIKGKRSQIVN